jgi:DNA-binding NarL/FixJ family response regulator
VIRIGVVDDHPVVLDGIASSLAQQEGLEVAWTAANLADARQALAATPCDVVVVDVRLPDGSGLDLVRRSGPPAFVVLSSWDRPLYARTAIERGASGFLLKTAPTGEVVAAIRAAAVGGTSYTAVHLGALDAASLPTPRELEVVRLLAAGKSNEEIARRLSVSPKTVEAYLTRLFDRWHVGSRTELALLGEREGWLEV